MGWFKVPFMGSATERRLARARKHMAVNFFLDALYELEGLEGDEAEALRDQARLGMVRVNLQEWRARTASGERQEARDALDRARKYGATDSDIDAFRKSESWDSRPPEVTGRPRPRA
jgi:hypothetical protein